MSQNVLIVAAHADDEILGCGATMAWHISQGDRVKLLILTDGVTSRSYDIDVKRTREEELTLCAVQMNQRKQEARKAAQILGLNKEDLVFRDLADQRLDEYPFLYLVKCIEKIKNSFNPKIIYTHFWGDLNLDHELVCRAVLTAFRPNPTGKAEEIFHFEIPESTMLSIPYRHKAFQPNHYVDIGKTISLKLQALAVYESEKRIYPDRRSPEFINQLAHLRGKEAGMTVAEAFVRL